MTALTCPKGHDSSDIDFCSVCGTKIPPATLLLATCPDCHAAREPADATFCEVCGFNYTTGAHGDLLPSSSKEIPNVAQPSDAAPQWEVEILVDPSLRAAESPEPPTDFQPMRLILMKDSNLIGRTSERRGVFPEVSLDRDDAVSHRHALLTRGAGGTWTIRDIGSANGTSLNGNLLEPLTDQPCKEGDTITLGHWTRMTLKAVS